MTRPAPPVFRQLAIPVPVFDYIKDYQRAHQARHQEQLTIVQTISAIVREHQQNEERELHEQTSRQPAILRNR